MVEIIFSLRGCAIGNFYDSGYSMQSRDKYARNRGEKTPLGCGEETLFGGVKIVTWNVNGIRSVMRNGFLSFVQECDPDILCIQESKAHPDDVSELLNEHNLQSRDNGEAESRRNKPSLRARRNKPSLRARRNKHPLGARRKDPLWGGVLVVCGSEGLFGCSDFC